MPPNFGDDLMLGPVASPRGAQNTDGPSVMELGAGPMGRVYVWDVVAATSNSTGLAVTQIIATSATAALTPAGAATVVVDKVAGGTCIQLDVPRVLTVRTNNVGDVTQQVIFSGYDQYWKPMTALVTIATTAMTNTLKAFKYVKSVSFNTVVTGSVALGFGEVLGAPYRIMSKDYVVFNYNGTAGVMASVTAGDTTPATNATGDVRGLITLATASDGAKRLVGHHALSALQCGPNATATGLYGVTQA